MPLTGAEYRRVVVSRGFARAQSELAACDPRRLRGHRDHHDRVKHADDGAGCASNKPPSVMQQSRMLPMSACICGMTVPSVCPSEGLPGSAAAWVTNCPPAECFTVVATLTLTPNS